MELKSPVDRLKDHVLALQQQLEAERRAADIREEVVRDLQGRLHLTQTALAIAEARISSARTVLQ